MNRHERRAEAAREKAEAKRRLKLINRQCGECTVCCTVMAVNQISKPAYEECEHVDGGCGIYEARPEPCKTFRCLWHHGLLPEDCRPDKLGVMFDVSGDGPFGQVPVAWEVHEGSSLRALKLLKDFVANGKPVIVAYKDKRRIIGLSPEEAAEVQLDLRTDDRPS